MIEASVDTLGGGGGARRKLPGTGVCGCTDVSSIKKSLGRPDRGRWRWIRDGEALPPLLRCSSSLLEVRRHSD